MAIKLMMSPHLLNGLCKLCPLDMLAQGHGVSLTDHAGGPWASWVLSMCGGVLSQNVAWKSLCTLGNVSVVCG
jgi:hypothetical protein